MHEVERHYYIDWLRVAGILLLFPFHTARIFDHWEWNYIKDEPNWFSSWFISGTSFWFMPLLFLIAGYASWYALKKRSSNLYIKERLSRLFIPFTFGLVLIVPPQGYFAKLQHFDFKGNYLEHLSGFFINFSDLSGYNGTFTPAHLWFILYLFVISFALLPLMNLIKTKYQNVKMISIVNFSNKPYIFILLFIPLTLSEALPDLGGKNLFYFAMFFLLGYMLSAFDILEKTVDKLKLPALVCVIPLSVSMIYLSWLWKMPSDFSKEAIIVALMRNLSVLLILMLLLGYGRRLLNKGGRVLSYLNQAAFPIYILHQTLMMVIACYVVLTNFPPTLKFVVIMLSALLASFAGFEILKRFKITRYVFGIKD